ncbi:DUF6457 domain-containing protein [Corynebacterium mendelii]|uniref:DUF6457 domain-containing protein n=1 Tax=Corynebacterium mendelii TaxID=2765362 RepID=A0A939E1J0_9CORY|nr:DUF6457 domain-containing protein [Corynebacterium mendelii]MBN9643827.1 hypothetical protein [Corynebacterium mendelii]
MHPDLGSWVEFLGEKLGVNPADVPLEQLLGMTKTVAHQAVRPGAPIAAFMVGLAAGRGQLGSVAEGVEVAEKAALEFSPQQED